MFSVFSPTFNDDFIYVRICAILYLFYNISIMRWNCCATSVNPMLLPFHWLIPSIVLVQLMCLDTVAMVFWWKACRRFMIGST